jgi:hypothetical protein
VLICGICCIVIPTITRPRRWSRIAKRQYAFWLQKSALDAKRLLETALGFTVPQICLRLVNQM